MELKKKRKKSGFIFCLLPQFSQNKNAYEMSSRFMDAFPLWLSARTCVYTHTHIVILCLRGKRDFSTRFVWAERTSTIPRVLSHIERYGCVWYICFGICKQVNNDEIIENKIHFSRWDSVYLPTKTLKCSNFINIFIFIFWTDSQLKIMWTCLFIPYKIIVVLYCFNLLVYFRNILFLVIINYILYHDIFALCFISSSELKKCLLILRNHRSLIIILNTLYKKCNCLVFIKKQISLFYNTRDSVRNSLSI